MSHSGKFNYKVIYSRRRSISVSLSAANDVVVRCPFGTSERSIEAFLNRKRGWLDSHMAKNDAVLRMYAGMIGYRQILVCGRMCRLEICGENDIGDGFVRVVSLSGLKDLFVGRLGNAFLGRMKAFACANGFNFKSVKFGSYKGKWGSCDGDGNITFNYKLLMLPERLQDFVIAHELCHTVHHNHSRHFHSLLDAVRPCNGEEQRELKNYSFVAGLYERHVFE